MDHLANRHSRPSSSGSHDDDTSSTHPIFPFSREYTGLMHNQAAVGPASGISSATASVFHGIPGSGSGSGARGEDLEKPTPPFMGISSVSRTFTNNSISALNSGRSSPVLHSPGSEHKLVETDSQISLSTHYLPSKFSTTMLNPGARRRKGRGGKGEGDSPHVPKMGGGTEAFRSGEARMPVEGDEDYDGVNIGGSKKTSQMSWNRFKWTLFVANLVLTVYSLVALIICLLTWFNIWTKADLVRIGNRPELIISTLASSIGVFTSMIGWSGIVLNNRSFLAVYNFFLWITFLFMLIPGYMSYKRHTFNLEGKINSQWSRELGPDGRLRVQNVLGCCGYFSPFIEATVSQTCYSRSILPGCKLHYLQFERMVLRKWYTVVFSIVPAHIGVIVAGLLCSNHVTYRFGKGMMPKAYRLSMNSMAVIMDHYANQLAEQYGSGVASEILAKSKSGIQLDGLPAVAYSQSLSKTPSVQLMMTKFDTIGNKGE